MLDLETSSLGRLIILALRLTLCPPPLMGGMVLATSKKTNDRKFPLGAYPSGQVNSLGWRFGLAH